MKTKRFNDPRLTVSSCPVVLPADKGHITGLSAHPHIISKVKAVVPKAVPRISLANCPTERNKDSKCNGEITYIKALKKQFRLV